MDLSFDSELASPAPAERILVFDTGGRIRGRIVDRVLALDGAIEVRTFAQFRRLAEDVETGHGPLAIVVVVDEGSRTVLDQIRIVHEEYPGLAIMLVVPLEFWIAPVELVRLGAAELVPDEAPDGDLDASLDRLIRLGRAYLRTRQPSTAAVERPEGALVSVVSANGGVGRTFLAVNLAAWLRREGRGSVCVVDLGGPYSGVSTALRLRPVHSVGQAARATDDLELLADELDEYPTSFADGFDVLCAGDDPGDDDELRPETLAPILDLLVRRYQTVVVDCPVGLGPMTVASAARSDRICAVGSLDLPALRVLRLFLGHLADHDIPAERVSVAINRVAGNLAVDLGDACNYLGVEPCHALDVTREARKTMNLGTPLVTADARSPLAGQLDGLFRALTGPEEGHDSSAAGAMGGEPAMSIRGLIGRWR